MSALPSPAAASADWVGGPPCGPTVPFTGAFTWACALDVLTRKPGNVSVASPGHGMRAEQFLASAQAAAPALVVPGLGVGARVEGAVIATRSRVGCNTNLGILLLAAPLARAVEGRRLRREPSALRAALARVLAALDLEDSRAAFRAIALAAPGGLGRAEREDVRAEPALPLGAAMALAAGRDRIAAQYVSVHADVFELGWPAFATAWHQAREAGLPGPRAAQQALLAAYLELLAAWPDSHIVRKHGAPLAHCVMAEARPWRDAMRQGALDGADTGLAGWDEALKERGLNPGTSADLAVASALVAALLEPGLAAAAQAGGGCLARPPGGPGAAHEGIPGADPARNM